MKLAAAREERGHDGHTKAAADITHQIEDAGGVAHLFLGDARHAVGHQPDEQKAESDALEHLRPENVPVARVEVEVGERKHGERRKRPQAN